MGKQSRILFAVFVSTVFTGCPKGQSFPELTEMVSINGGSFTMGLNLAYCDDGKRSVCDPFASPVHEVKLSAYFVDKHEVTNGQYRKCVHDGKCVAPNLEEMDNYYKSPDFFNHPVTNVTWQLAHDYCEWAGRRLPTEAEWEFVARPAGEMFPWGDTLADVDNCDQVFLQGCPSPDGPGQVKNASGDQSPFGVNDLGGNVAEWVSDRFSEFQYCLNTESCEESDPNCIYEPCDFAFTCLEKTSIERDPRGPDNGPTRVYRGGSFADDRCYGAGFVRRVADPSHHSDSIGFRCAKNWGDGNDLGGVFDQGIADNGVADIRVVDDGTDGPVWDQSTDIASDIVSDIVSDISSDHLVFDIGVDTHFPDSTVDQTVDAPLPPTGVILHYNGSNWSSMNSGTSKRLKAVWGNGPSDVFAVGESGTIVHYDGSTWSSQNSGTTMELRGIIGFGSDDVYVIGKGSPFLHYDGKSWSNASPVGSGQAIWGPGPTDLFVLWASQTVTNWNGSSWSAMNTGTWEPLFAIWGTASDNVFVVGQDIMMRYDGSSWLDRRYFSGFVFMSIWGF